MSGLRYDRILAGTALALVLAAPLGAARAQHASAGAVAAVPTSGPKPRRRRTTRFARACRPKSCRQPANLRGQPPRIARPSRPKRRLTPIRLGRSHRAGLSRRRPMRPQPLRRRPRRRPPRSLPTLPPDRCRRSAGFARSCRPGHRRKDARPVQRQGRQDLRQQERAGRRRGVLSKPQSCAAVVRQGHRERAQQGRGDAPEGRRRRRPRRQRLQAAESRQPVGCGRAGRGRAEVYPDRAHLRPPRASRPLPLYPHQPQQRRAAAGAARCRRRARPRSPMRPTPPRRSTHSARRRPRTRSSRQRSPSCAARRSGGHKEIADGPVLKFVSKKPDGRSRACRCCASVSKSRATVPTSHTTPSSPTRSRNSRRPTICRPTAALDAQDRQAAQRAGQEPADRHHPRQHGALALVSARSRQGLFDGQPAGLHAARSSRTARRSGRTRVVIGKPTMRRRC